MGPLTAIDICGHEMTHGVTSFTANLNYQGESGAMNEGFSDIMGIAIKFYAKPATATWQMGPDIGTVIRDMSNPNAYQQPDTYNGTYWYNSTGCTPSANNDECGVHTNSGVINYWYYLLSHGGSGTNDIGNAFNVSALGMDTASSIAYRTLTTYLVPASQYADARFYAIQAATDLYGACSPAVASTAASLYVRPLGLTIHRPTQAGVRFSTNSSSHNQQYIRQTRRYFRYQSGKGIQMSTGTTLKAQLNLDGVTSSGTLCTVITKDPHNINSGVTIVISGANESAYNGTFTIQNVITPYTFTYVANTTPANPVASGPVYGSVSNWYGAQNRIGIFDSQNGMFWQWDGQTLSAVRRSSVYQISGQFAVTPGSATVTVASGFNSYLSKQLLIGDFIVIKGMSFRVTNILSDSTMTISPPYRGNVVQSNAVVSRTVDYIVPSSQFNVDRLDGTGPSGYTIDLTKMQMFYIDYSWYGAGFIRFGVRGPDGNIVYCHRIVNNNVNYLSYMRSGNLPGRYETSTFSKITFMTGGASGINTNLLPTDTTINASSTSGFPNTGTLLVRNVANTEFMNYSGLTSNSFTGLTRANLASVLTTTGNLTNGNNYITSLGSTTGVQINQYIFGQGVPNQSYVTQIPNNTTIVMSQAAIANGTSNTIVFTPLGNTAQTFSYSTTAQTAIELHSPQFGPEVNHWGTSAIMDGGFTTDKSFIFTKGMQSSINVASGSTQAVMSFRIAPGASNGIPAPILGQREIINRLQHLPFEADVYANGSFLITCVLNGTTSNTAEQWINVGGSSLSQYIFHTQGTSLSGGEAVFGFFLNTQGTSGLYATTQQDLTQLLAIGTSILSGGSANASTSIYPNGPDVLTFIAQNIQTGANAATIQARYSWNEAQA